MDLSGATTLHGPVSVDFVVPTAVTLSGLQAGSAGSAWPMLFALLAAGAALSVAVRQRRGQSTG